MRSEQARQLTYFGDRAWHQGTDAWGNPVWYRAFGWSYTLNGPSERGGEQEPHEHGRTASRHYQRRSERIRDDVYDRLNDHPNIDSSDIEVQVDQSIVTLAGTVHDRREKRLAEDIAGSVSGVRDVQNNLRVGQSNGGPTQHEGREQAAQKDTSQRGATAGTPSA
jgi:hypothetical protein